MTELVLALAFLAGPGQSLPNDAQPRVRPRLFVAERDPFAGLPALRARWAAGARPSPDLPGLALSWLLSGDPSFAERALDELRADRPTGWQGSSRYVRYLNRAMAFDWLHAYPGFDAALERADREATLPDVKTRRLLLAGLEPEVSYEVQVTSGLAPGAPVWRATAEAGAEGVLSLPWDAVRDGRLRLRRPR